MIHDIEHMITCWTTYYYKLGNKLLELHAIYVLNNHVVAYEDKWTTHEMR